MEETTLYCVEVKWKRKKFRLHFSNIRENKEGWRSQSFMYSWILFFSEPSEIVGTWRRSSEPAGSSTRKSVTRLPFSSPEVAIPRRVTATVWATLIVNLGRFSFLSFVLNKRPLSIHHFSDYLNYTNISQLLITSPLRLCKKMCSFQLIHQVPSIENTRGNSKIFVPCHSLT